MNPPLKNSVRLSIGVVALVVLAFTAEKAHPNDAEVPATHPPPLFSVKFTAAGVEFTGSVISEESGQALAAAVKSARPDLTILNRGLTVDPEVNLPALNHLKSLLSEISYSTHEGGFAIWEDSILVTGLTDSRITLTALKIRLDPILKSRSLVNRICIVPSEDLPRTQTRVTDTETGAPLLDFEVYPTATESYSLPGLPPEKIFPTLLLLSDFSRLDRSPTQDLTSPPGAPMRAIPLIVAAEGNADATALSPAEALLEGPAEPQKTLVTLKSIRFSSNTVLLRANQETVLNEVAAQLNDPPLAGLPVILRPVWISGSGVLADYLAERRGEEVVRMLSEREVDSSRFLVRKQESTSGTDEGEVRILVEVPPPPEPVANGPDGLPTNPDDAPGNAAAAVRKSSPEEDRP